MVEVWGDALRITSRGRTLLSTVQGSQEERACFLGAMKDARALRPFASFFLGDELAQEEIAQRLQSLTGLSPSTALRRAATLIQWRRYVTLESSPNTEGPTLPDLASEIGDRVKRHNALASQEFRAWMGQMEPRKFEHLVADLCKALGWQDVKVTGGAGDGGIDVEGVRLAPGGHREPAMVQAKRCAHAVGPAVVRGLSGTLTMRRFVTGMLVTTSDFTPQAREEAKQDVRIQLVAGLDLVELLAANAVALCYGKYGEITRAE